MPSTARTSNADPFEGTQYRLVRALAKGGMGQVFLVEHRRLGRQFVAKLLHDELASQPQLLDRFRIEAQSLGRLHHPNIVAIFGFEITKDKQPFLVTEYLPGQTIAQELAAGRVFTVPEAIRYARELLAALAAAHELGIVHRDIKPQNLMLCELPDAGKQLKVLDFGLARVIPGISPRAPEPLKVPTDTGVVFGTPHYVSPEAALGQHVDHRADIYGAGLILYTLLARRGPFDEMSGNAAMMAAHLMDQPEPPSRYAKALVPATLDALVLKALHKDASQRIQSAREFDELLATIEAALLASSSTSDEAAAEESVSLVRSNGPSMTQRNGRGTTTPQRREVPANDGLVTTKTAPVENEHPRQPTWRTALTHVSVTILATLTTLLIGYLLLGRHGAP